MTYPLGEDVSFKNLRIFRVPNLLRLKKIKIGPSYAKVPLDALLTLKAGFRVLTKRYDLIFSHEEAALPGVVLSRLGRVPHIYDMHSSLPQQLENFEFSRSTFLKGPLRPDGTVHPEELPIRHRDLPGPDVQGEGRGFRGKGHPDRERRRFPLPGSGPGGAGAKSAGNSLRTERRSSSMPAISAPTRVSRFSSKRRPSSGRKRSSCSWAPARPTGRN